MSGVQKKVFIIFLAFLLPAPLMVSAQQGQGYTGDIVSLDYREANVIEVYNDIARQTGLNIVVHPGVKGNITVKLFDVHWQKALEVILETMGHEARIDVNTVFIAPAGKLN